jgi:competence protein ComEC
VSLLITGDIEGTAEAALVVRYGCLAADVLQLPHHGSGTSSSGRFLAAIRPRLALAASGTTPRFRYPDAGVVRRLLAVPAVVLAQRDGAAVVDWTDDPAALRLDRAVMLPMTRARRD